MAKKTSTALKISVEVKRLAKYLSIVSGYALSDIVIESIEIYRSLHGSQPLYLAPVQEPRDIVDTKTINVSKEVQAIVKKMSLHQIGGMVGAMDRLIITYQNHLISKGDTIPDNIKVDWLDPDKARGSSSKFV